MLQLAETNTYLIESARADQEGALAAQINEDFRALTGPNLQEFIGSNDFSELMPDPIPPPVFTVMLGCVSMQIDPAVSGTAIDAAGVQPNPGALGMHADLGGTAAPDYSSGESNAGDLGTDSAGPLASIGDTTGLSEMMLPQGPRLTPAAARLAA